MITLAIFWGIWAMVSAGIMLVDRILSDDTFGAPLQSYFVLAAITPFLVLPVYFFSSHRSSSPSVRWGLTLAGVPLTVVCSFFAFYHLGVYVTLVRCVLA